jgi:two-component system sensor histidine kinase ChvG
MKADVEKLAGARPRRVRPAGSSAAASKLRRSYEDLTTVVARAPQPAPEQDRAAEHERPEQSSPEIPPHKRNIFSRWIAAAERRRMQVANRGFSSITRRIMLLNLSGLVALVAGILYLSEYRENLVDARVQSLLTQGEIIAAAIAASATADTRALTVDPDKLLELKAGETYGPGEDILAPFDFPINPERVAPLLRRLVSPTDTRARIYDRDGTLLLDSSTLYTRGDILRFDLPAPNAPKPGFIEKQWNSIYKRIIRGELPLYKELGPGNGRGYEEVASALYGVKESVVRTNERGEVIVSVAVPVQRFRGVHGALLLSTQGKEIDDAVESERLVILGVFAMAATIMVVLSMLLARSIGGPLRRLAGAAEHVRRRNRTRVEIPNFTYRSDEIGHLSGAIRDMTDALYSRIEAIESFAADVSHELKNPLTSLRSAVETLPMVKTQESRDRLLEVIQHDIRRLDRLISDISDASRLDAEMQRQESAPVDVHQLLSAVVKIADEVPRDDGVHVVFSTGAVPGAPRTFIVPGHDSRLGQVIDNLVENARSFSPRGGTVRVSCRRLKDEVEIMVEDEGPGIRSDALEKIFERFYTDRPEHGFGQNSGLGLSISRQIVEGHGGRIWAENRLARPRAGAEPEVKGARFVVRLPAA